MGNEILPKELIRSIHELEKHLIEADTSSIYLQTAFNKIAKEENSGGDAHSSSHSGMLSTLEALESIDAECDLLLSNSDDLQSQMNATANKLVDQHSILNICARKTGLPSLHTTFSPLNYTSSSLAAGSLYNLAGSSDQLIDIDLGHVVQSYFDQESVCLEKSIRHSLKTINSCENFVKLLLQVSNVDKNFVDAALYTINAINTQISMLLSISSERSQFELSKQLENSKNSESSKLRQTVQQIFGPNDKNNDSNELKPPFPINKGPSPFADLNDGFKNASRAENQKKVQFNI